jgi:hypothetical protein
MKYTSKDKATTTAPTSTSDSCSNYLKEIEYIVQLESKENEKTAVKKRGK